MIIFIALCFLLYFIGKKIGRSKARKEIDEEIKKLHIDNPYIYFRDIPNKYGIGVATSILNYEFDKNIILAAILDLCAKKYISLVQKGKNYEIVDNKKDRSLLLKNELYILDRVLNRNVKKINLKEWRTYCIEDSINLGLAFKKTENKYKILFKMDAKYAKNLLITSYVFSFFLIEYFDHYIERSINFIEALFMALFLAGPIFLIVFFAMLMVGIFYDGIILSYNSKKNNMLELTELGKNEFHELCSLGKFLDDFGRFAEKCVEDIVIWEQYLSYALLFKISEKIINTGYKKLTINECFVIENINNIAI